MTNIRRRAVLEGIAFGPDSTENARMRSLELLDRLDEREPPPEPEWTQPTERDPDRLSRAISILVANGCLDAHLAPIIEARVAQELRARFSIVGDEDDESAADGSEDEEKAGGPADTSQAVSEAANAEDDLPLEARVPGLAALKRWPDNPEPSRLRDRFRSRN